MTSQWKSRMYFLGLFLIFSGEIFAQEKLIPIAEQESILYNSIEKVLKNHPEIAKDTRLLGVGSWMAGKAGATC